MQEGKGQRLINRGEEIESRQRRDREQAKKEQQKKDEDKKDKDGNADEAPVSTRSGRVK